jgi:hypothetical protein
VPDVRGAEDELRDPADGADQAARDQLVEERPARLHLGPRRVAV